MVHRIPCGLPLLIPRVSVKRYHERNGGADGGQRGLSSGAIVVWSGSPGDGRWES